ncbi:MAG: peroxidase-related enzyme, partial [Bacteroidales bacterium]
MSRIKVISHEESQGRLREIYDNLVATRGQLAEVHKIQSLRPESIVKHMELYLEIMFSRSPLSRSERELMAVVVSTANGCRYCAEHHGAALQHYWKDHTRLELVKEHYSLAGLSEKERLLCEYAESLTR